MALREVLQFPDPRLKRVSEPIEKIDDAIRELASDMLEVMYDEPGIGLAAPQAGVLQRFFVVELLEDEENEDDPEADEDDDADGGETVLDAEDEAVEDETPAEEKPPETWRDVSDNTVDPGVAYRYFHRDGSGRFAPHPSNSSVWRSKRG